MIAFALAGVAALIVAAVLARAMFHAARQNSPLLTAEGRRAAALLALLGGGIAMTVYAAVSLYLVRDVASYAFWLGLAAMALIAVSLTGFAGLLIKRTVKIGRDGIEISDQVTAETVANALAGSQIEEKP